MPQPSAIAGQAARDLVRAWRHLLATDVVFRVVAFVVLAPLAGLLVRAIVATTGRSVVADKDLISFFLDPFGVVALIILAGVGLAIMGFEQAGLMAVGRGVLRGRPVNCIEALRFVVDRWRSILALTTRIASKALLIAAPFLAVSGAIFLWLLTERDIYFYVSTKPPELWLALGLIGPILALGALAVAWKAIGWLLAFPLMLFEGATPADALIAAGERIAGHRRVAAQLLAGWLVLSVVASSTALAIVNLAGGVASGFVGGSGLTLVIVGGAMLTLWGAMNFAATFVSSAVAALLLVGAHDATSGAGERAPEAGTARHGEGISPRLAARRLVAGLAAATLIAATVGALALRDLADPSTALAIAHRGASTFAPENTLAAVERAISDGADYVEIDVQETADGRVVVFHDDGFERLAGVDLFIWDATWDQLQDLDIGSWFAPEFADQRTPSLEQVLETARGRTKVLIELKYYGHQDRLEERVVEIVGDLGVASDVMIMTFDQDVVADLRRSSPAFRVGLLSSVALGNLARVQADFLAVDTRMATPGFVRAAHRAGREVMVWTVNDPVTAFAMVSRGVDGLIGDDPAMIRRVIAEHNEMSGVERLIADVAILTGALSIDDDPGQ